MYLISPNGGEREPLFQDGRHRTAPGFSPDGKWILASYLYWLEPPNSGIDSLDLRTRSLKRVPGSEGVFQARWSPNGKFLVGRREDHSSLVLFDAQSEKWTELAKGPLNWLRWSHDSRFVYFERDINRAVMRVRVSDNTLEEVVNLTGFNRAGLGFFSLAPDDTLLLLHNTGTEEIYALTFLEGRQAPK